MGRELKRKTKKQNSQWVEETTTEEKLEVRKVLTVLLFVFGLLFIAYLLVGIFVTKEINFDWFKKEETEISTDNILASEIFNQKEETYYVYCYDFNDYNSSIESSILNKLSDSKVYRVDTSSAFNKNYIADSGNASAQSKEELKLHDITLIKIENSKNVEYYEGEDAIEIFFNK